MLDGSRTTRPEDKILPYLRAANIQDDGLDLSDVNVMPYAAREAAALDLRRNDVLVVEGGAVGTCAVLDKDLSDWSFQKTVNRLRPRHNWSSRYIAHVLRAYRDSGVIDILCNRSTIPHLTAEKLRSLRVPAWDGVTQRAIADFLDHETAQIDALVAKQEELVVALRERRSSVVDRELNSGSLGRTRLKNLLDRNDGGVWGEDAARGEGTVVLRSTEQTVDGTWRIEDPARRSLTAKEFKAALLEVGDLLVTKTSGSSKHIGKTTLVDEHVSSMSACFGNFMQRLRALSGTSPKFLWYCLNSGAVREQFDLLSTTSTGLSNLNGSTIGSVLVPVHPESKQFEIVDHLDEQTSRIDTLIAKAEEHIALAKERRSALITAAVTGQIDVRTAAQKAS
jgi:type I restriction enzyme S subunit